MNLLDIIIIVIGGLGIWIGFRKGGIHQVAGIIGLMLAFMLGVQLMKPIGLIVAGSLNLSDQVAPLVGFVVVFLAVILTVTLLAKGVEYLIGAIKLGPLNKLLGGAVGGAKAVLILSIGLLFFENLGLPDAQTRAGSAFYPAIQELAPATWDVISKAIPNAERLADVIGTHVEEEVSGRVVPADG